MIPKMKKPVKDAGKAFGQSKKYPPNNMQHLFGGRPDAPPDGKDGGPGGEGGGPGGSSSEVIYAGDTEITSAERADGQTYSSTEADKSALMISTSEEVTVNDATVTKSGDSDGGDNCNLTANNTKCNGNATFMDTIMIYQSMSGDAASGTSSFTMTGGSLTSKNGHVFHVTNTSCVITLSNVNITNEDSDNVLISVCDDGWSGGSNKAVLNASAQTLKGAVLVGDNSELTINLTEGSTLEGCVSGNITNAKGGTVSTDVGKVSVTLDSTSTWTLTGDSYITEFNGDATNVISNGYKLYVNGMALTGTK